MQKYRKLSKIDETDYWKQNREETSHGLRYDRRASTGLPLTGTNQKSAQRAGH